MDINNIEDLYKNYNYLSDRFNKDIYLQILSDYNKKRFKDIKKALFPKNLSSHDIECRNDLLYLYIWDTLFFQQYEYDENLLWKDSKHKSKVIQSVQTIRQKNSDSYTHELIFTISYHWSELRALIFYDDYLSYEKCQSIDDYTNFIELYPNTYKELLYAAKYQLSLLSNTPFTEIQDVFTLFNDSELIPVHEIKSRCKSVGAFNVLFSPNLLAYPKLQDEVINLLSEIDDISSQTDSTDGLYISDLLTKKRYHLLSNPDSYDALMKIITNSCSFQFVTNYQAESFCKTLTQMTNLKFRLPRLFEIKDYCKSDSGSTPEWCYEDDSIIINEGKTVLRDTEQCYATFRLVVDK